MAVKIDLARKSITLGVGDLVAEGVASVGRVAGLSMWARMEMGRDVHTQHQRDQTELHQGYAREIFVRHDTAVDDFTISIQGRIDGVIPASGTGPIIVEEIKSVVMPPLMFAALSGESYPHYVEQLRLYCFFVQHQDATRAVAGRLVYINVADQSRKPIEVVGPFDDCASLITIRVRALIGQALGEAHRQSERRGRAVDLPFPHDAPRQHQDAMMAAVDNALQQRRHLLVSAPSGVGKTAGALYPAVKYALAHDQRVFFVTAKNTQHANAVATLRRMGAAGVNAPTPDGRSASGAPSAVAFRAREKMCINSIYACREEFCPHLQMISQKLERTGVAERLLARGVMTAEDLIEAGRGASVCPFELALLEAERTDVIICDYNYVFDPQVYFRRFFQENDYCDSILIIDEAHNLVQRAMQYYSPQLRRARVREVMPHLRMLEPSLAKSFRKTLARIDDFFRSMTRHAPDEYSQLDDVAPDRSPKFMIGSPRVFFEEIKADMNRLAVRYMLDKLTSGRVIPDDPIDEFLSDFGHFYSVLTLEGPEFAYVFDATDGEAIEIVCLDPSRQLQQRIEGFHSVIAMSATLEPMDFYRQMLGFSERRTDQATFPSPFPQHNRLITVVDDVLTTFRQRGAHYGKIADAICTTVESHRGHYMALFPSYDFLREVSTHLPGAAGLASRGNPPAGRVREIRPPFDSVPSEASDDADGEFEVIVQSSDMTEEGRTNLLRSLLEPEPPKLILAVQGGVFAEGVDYPGDLLSGVIVVSPALPPVNYERELMRRYYDQVYGKGFEYAYLYPGMNRVIQSVGRLIRTETDRGVAVLICQRFRQPQYRALFPVDWPLVARVRSARELATTLETFWRSFECSDIHKP